MKENHQPLTNRPSARPSWPQHVRVGGGLPVHRDPLPVSIRCAQDGRTPAFGARPSRPQQARKESNGDSFPSALDHFIRCGQDGRAPAQ